MFCEAEPDAIFNTPVLEYLHSQTNIYKSCH